MFEERQLASRGLAVALALTLALVLTSARDTRAQEGPVARPIATVTRLVTLFAGLENDWLQAVRDRDATAVEALLSEDFEMRTASRPDQPIPRGEWIRRALSGRKLSWKPQQMAARDLGGTVIVSFRLEPQPSGAALARRGAFVVDTWVQAGGGWKAAARYVAGADQLPDGLAGDAPASAGQPKKY